MDQPAVVKPAPYFNLDRAPRGASQLARSYSGQDSTLRAALVERLRRLVDDARTEARRQLEQDGDGRACAESLSAFQDALHQARLRLHHQPRLSRHQPVRRRAHGHRRPQAATAAACSRPGSDVDLLFLLPYKQTAWGESVVEYMLYLLWDLGLKVGHATRTVDQCVRLAARRHDHPHARCSTRALILGDEPLFDELISAASAREVVQRHARASSSRPSSPSATSATAAPADRAIRVEPNIKDGKGGLRDLHTLHWLAKYLYRRHSGEAFGRGRRSSRADEYATFRRCEDFLWSVQVPAAFPGRAGRRSA